MMRSLKLRLAAAAAAAAASSVCAAATVSMYGVVDEGIEYSKSPGDNGVVKMTSGYLSGSRWGLRGSEDLGNGSRVFFQLEEGFSADTGAMQRSGYMFSRQAYLGFGGDWGEIAAGRIGGLSSDCGNYAILPQTALTTSYSTKADTYSAFILVNRYSNNIVYKSPSMGGVTASVMYANSTGTDDGGNWSDNGHYYGVGAVYESNGLTANIIAEYLDNKDSEGRRGTQLLTAGFTWDIGGTVLGFVYQYAKNAMLIENYMDASKFIGGSELRRGARQHAFMLSAVTPFMHGTLGIQANYATGRFQDVKEGEDEYEVYSAGAVYGYPFSRRTLVYGFAGYGAARKALRTSDADSIRGCAFSVGLRHKF